MIGRMLIGAAIIAIGSGTSGFGAAASAAQDGPPQTGPVQEQPARAVFRDPEGRAIGTASLVGGPNGVLIIVNVEGLPPGLHGFHIHETGRCEAPSFQSAGGHFNPTGHQHGFLAPDGMHAGDLPNLTADDQGNVRASIFATEVTLDEGEAALLGGDGTSLVIHERADDYVTDPTGESGGRIACAVIER